MLAKTQTACLWGIQAQPVIVETDLQPGLPALHVVGLADLTIKEAKERIRPAICNSGYRFPAKRITINLSPAGTPKEGSHFDLPIAVGILLSEQRGMEDSEFPMPALIGELSLDGKLHSVRGVLPMVLGLREQGIREVILPEQNIGEVSSIGDIRFYPAGTLQQVMEHIMGSKKLSLYDGCGKKQTRHPRWEEDFEQVLGQESVKRALTIAAAGQHGILMLGSPGSGKTMMARRLPSILPDLSYEEQMETTKIHSICGLLTEEQPAVVQRPFRAPHHTISKTALVGGGKRPFPGEISLAHNGVLFLDELGEFDSRTLELLRQPMEEASITISRAAGSIRFPSRFMLVAASNPCKCGYLGDENHVCTCTERQIQSYMSRFSGPLLDRIDMHIKIASPDYSGYKQSEEMPKPMSSKEMRRQVEAAAERQKERYRDTGIFSNSRLTSSQIKKYCVLGDEEKEMMEMAYRTFRLNMRTCHKILKAARTIADLEGREKIQRSHLAEALQYRTLEHLYRRA